MKERILDRLVCPVCQGPLTLDALSRYGEEVKEGLLTCTCGQWFPIIRFVPRLLPRGLRGNYSDFVKSHGLHHLEVKTEDPSRVGSGEVQVQKSFGSKWMSQPTWGIAGETNAFMRKWILDKYGWKDEEGFRKAIGRKRAILDAGTGVGRLVIDFCTGCKGGEVFGVDLSDAVDAAYENTKACPNAHILQADLMHPPFKKSQFDLIFSEGVLHHTPDTRKSFETLLGFLTAGGEMAAYIYRKKGPIREFCDDYLRAYTTQLSEKECWDFSRRMTALGKTLSDLRIEFDVPEDIPLLNLKAGRYNLQRFFYYHVLKCFWRDGFTFDENSLINFDWYHPAHAWRHTPEEVKRWCAENNLSVVWWLEEDSGVSFRTVK